MLGWFNLILFFIFIFFQIHQLKKYISLHKTNQESQVLVAYPCNPSYLGGRVQEDHGSKPVLAK
jgi:hypothetical protein